MFNCTCQACKITSPEFHGPSWARSSGWAEFHTIEYCNPIWVCPDCKLKIQNKAQRLCELLGTDDIMLSQLL